MLALDVARRTYIQSFAIDVFSGFHVAHRAPFHGAFAMQPSQVVNMSVFTGLLVATLVYSLVMMAKSKNE
jgi:hypothetical protein